MRSRSRTASRSSRFASAARALQALLERHVEPLEDDEVVLDLVADRRRDELRVVALARGEQLDDVRVTLDALEELLLHLEAHLVFVGDAALQDLDDDRPAESRSSTRASAPRRGTPSRSGRCRARSAGPSRRGRTRRCGCATRTASGWLITPDTAVIGGPGIASGPDIGFIAAAGGCMPAAVIVGCMITLWGWLGGTGTAWPCGGGPICERCGEPCGNICGACGGMPCGASGGAMPCAAMPCAVMRCAGWIGWPGCCGIWFTFVAPSPSKSLKSSIGGFCDDGALRPPLGGF